MIAIITKNYDIHFSGGRAGKYKSLAEFDEWELQQNTRPRYGRYWWFWIPNLKSNGGKFDFTDCVDINFHFLCFWLSLTFFPNKK